MTILVYLIDGVIDSYVSIENVSFINGDLTICYNQKNERETTYTYPAGTFIGFRVGVKNWGKK